MNHKQEPILKEEMPMKRKKKKALPGNERHLRRKPHRHIPAARLQKPVSRFYSAYEILWRFPFRFFRSSEYQEKRDRVRTISPV